VPLSNPLIHDTTVLLAYFLMGLAVKFIDQAYDIRGFNKKTATYLAVPTAGLMGFLMVIAPPSAAIFLAVAIGVAVAHKIDNIAFYIGLWIVILLPLLFSSIAHMMWLPFGVLLTAAVADEYGNNWADIYSKKKKKAKNALLEGTAILFSYRSAMKVTMLALVVMKEMPLIYFPAFLLFDFGYVLMDRLSIKIKPYRLKNPWDPAKQSPIMNQILVIPPKSQKKRGQTKTEEIPETQTTLPI
jgi:hypothetical protein